MGLKKTKLILPLILLFFFPGLIIYAQKWTDGDFESFSKGDLGAGGQNIYVSKNGGIRTIRRFDLNQDSYIDLLFNSTHNDDAYIPASVATFSADGQINTSEIQVPGSLHSSVSDLNKDGYLDLVFCPNPSGIQNPRRFVTIAYGEKDGWTPRRTNGLLPVNDVKSVAIADLNKDGWPDIATLNSSAWRPGQPTGNILRIYWGGSLGFSLDRYHDIGIMGAKAMISSDLDADGFDDLAVSTNKHHLKIIWSSKASASTPGKFTPVISQVKLPAVGIQCLATADLNKDKKIDFLLGGNNRTIYILNGKGNQVWDTPKMIRQVDASSISAEDLDKDGHIDLVVSRFSLQKAAGGEMLGGKALDNNNIKIFWGNKGSFSDSRVSELETPYTVATAIGDLNNDQWPDIVCAVHQGVNSYSTESIIYYGKNGRKFEQGNQGIPGSGAYHATIVKANKHQAPWVIISNSRAGNLNEAVPLQLYWGSSKGFTTDNRLDIPFKSGYEASAADFNEDGYVDLLAINSMHSGTEGDWSRGVNIFWGTEKGYQLGREGRTVLHEEYVSTSNAADLNKDGYLDLVIGFFGPYDHANPTDLVIYYGSGNGFERKNRKAIPCKGRSSSPSIADYNKDGWLDIAVTSYEDGLLRIFWGSQQGFSENRLQAIPFHEIIDLETADLNNDGFLDLIATSYKDRVNDHHDTGVLIYWGSAEGYKTWNAQWLPASTALGPTVADFDGDGYLDLFLPSYHGDITREYLPMYLYWGSKEGFKINNKTVLVGETGGTDALAADFDKDGRLDLAVAGHTLDGFHSKGIGKIFYNDGNRFSGPNLRVTDLPAPGSHWIWNYDMGHIYDRKWEESYTSKVFNLIGEKTVGTLQCEAEIPTGTKLVVFGKSAATKENLESTSWSEIHNNNLKLSTNDLFFQYKIKLISDNGDRYPIIKKVSIDIQ